MSKGQRIDDGVLRAAEVTFSFDGRDYRAPAGESLAAALLANGIRNLRCAPEDGGARGAFCFMGLCQECLVVVDGRHVEACRLPVSAGLAVRRLVYEGAAEG